MEEYTFNNNVYTKDTLQLIANNKGYTFDELLEKNPDIQVKKSPTSQDALVETGTASDTVYKSGNFFLDSQEDDEK